LLVLAAIVEAVIGARRMHEFRPAWYTRWYTCLLVYFVVVVASAFYSNAVRAHMAAYHTFSASMIPALQVGDYFIVRRPPPRGPVIRSGDIVVFQGPLSISPDRADWSSALLACPATISR
jgi:signal peptidase I